jgi:FkbM family methyltransferase
VSFVQAWLTAASIRFRVRALKARFRDQKVEFGVIRQYLRPTDIACDIGANKGSFIYWLSSWCANGGVVAFEPQPELARGLEKICRLIKLDNVKVEAKAVFSHSGEQDLFVPRGHQPGASLGRKALEGENFDILSVPLVSLDTYFSEHDKIGLLKIDAEGAEFDILKGAERILRQHAPLLVFECENRHLAHGSVNDVFAYLESLGYEGYFVCRGQLLAIARFDAAVHQRQSGEWFWKSKDYCNNFIFRKPSAPRGTAAERKRDMAERIRAGNVAQSLEH